MSEPLRDEPRLLRVTLSGPRLADGFGVLLRVLAGPFVLGFRVGPAPPWLVVPEAIAIGRRAFRAIK